MLCGSVMEVIEAGLLGLLGCFSAFRNQNPEPWQRDKSLPARSASAGLQLSPGLSQAHPTPAGSSRPALALLQPAGHPALALPKEHQGLAAESSLVPHQGECHRPDCPGEGGRAGHLPGLGAGQAAVLSSWRKPGVMAEPLPLPWNPCCARLAAHRFPGRRGWLRKMWPQVVPKALLRAGQSLQLFPH